VSPTTAADDLAGYLGSRLAADLRAWQNAYHLRVRVPARPWRPTAGYTGAVLATLVIEDGRAAYQVMMKACAPKEWESGRHLQAWRDHPEFARRHLIRLLSAEFGLWRTDDDGLLLFQELAGDGGPCRMLSELPAEQLAAACGLVTRALLSEWNDGPVHTRRETMDGFLRHQLGPAALANGSVRRWADSTGLADNRTQWIRTAADGAVWPNPVTMVFGDSPVAGRPIDCLTGYGHGDLHLDNILLPVGRDGQPDPARFAMIDLATYSPAAPLSADVVYLMLSAIAVRLPQLPERCRTELLDAVTGAAAPAGRDPAFGVVAAVLEAARAAIGARRQGWTGNWSQQCLLSTLALGLLFTTYEGLGPEVRWWFLELAARAGAAVVGESPPPGRQAALLDNPFRQPATVAERRPLEQPENPPPERRRSRQAPLFDLTARAWHEAYVHSATEARRSLREARREVEALETSAAVGAMSDLLADTVHILGSDDEVTLEFRYDLALLTSRVTGRAAEARQLFDAARAEYARVLGNADRRTLECLRARDSTSLVRRARTGG
jgi:hypothetical protein